MGHGVDQATAEAAADKPRFVQERGERGQMTRVRVDDAAVARRWFGYRAFVLHHLLGWSYRQIEDEMPIKAATIWRKAEAFAAGLHWSICRSLDEVIPYCWGLDHAEQFADWISIRLDCVVEVRNDQAWVFGRWTADQIARVEQADQWAARRQHRAVLRAIDNSNSHSGAFICR